MTKARIDRESWARCGKCGHKLFKVDSLGDSRLEIKCHSCKSINVFDGKNTEKENGFRWLDTEKAIRLCR